MEKQGLFRWILMLPVAVLSWTGCTKQEAVLVEDPILSSVIGQAGGVVEGFDGEVVLTVPAGALTEETKFFMYELNFKSTQREPELLKAFVIEPNVTFNVPAKLTVHTNGCLSVDKSVGEGMDVVLYIYENVRDYSERCGQCCVSCCYEVTSLTVSACIGKTGIITVIGDMRPEQEYNIAGPD